MEKKITKKELKEMEDLQKELRQNRNDVINSVKQFRGDVEATRRYYRINNMSDKLTYSGDITDEEEEKILRNYKALDFVKVHYEKDEEDYRMWDFIRMMMNSKAQYEIWDREPELIIDRKYLQDGLWNNDIVWNENQLNLYLRYAKKFGYKYFITTDGSTAALGTIAMLIKKGAKAIDTCTTKYYKDELKGIVFDISEANAEIVSVEKEEDSVIA